jgi:hypothetical protein
MKQIIIATAIALATTSGFASASNLPSESFSDSYSLRTNWIQDLTLTGFDSTLGTLKEVDITLDGHFLTTGQAANTGNLANDVFSLTSAGNMTFTNSILGISDLLTATPTTSPNFSVAPGGSTTFGGLTYTSTLHDVLPGITSFSPAQLAMFESLNWSINAKAINTSGVNFISQNGNYLSGPSTIADATVTVTYIYNANGPGIPEPASIALLAAGLFGFAFRRKAA